jgi:cob(I)alamin adenosyltransferase
MSVSVSPPVVLPVRSVTRRQFAEARHSTRSRDIILPVTLYTRTGDGGETALFDGRRVSKADLRVDAYGEIDELNAALGVALAAGVAPDEAAMLEQIQRDLFAVGGTLADPAHRVAGRVQKMAVGQADVSRLEQWIDRLEDSLPPLRHFILPGGSPQGAALHLARTICRRAERRIVSLRVGEVDPVLLAYLNRLSDFLFVAARAVNQRAGITELKW